MILRRLSSVLLASTVLLSSLSGAFSQSKEPIGLLADTVDYDRTSQVLTARGHVRIVSNGQILTTDNVVYNQTTGKLNIPNGFTITNLDGSIMTGDNADLSSDLSENVIKGARLLIAGQFQLAADQAQYKDQRFKVLDRVVASTCYVGKPHTTDNDLDTGQCKINPIPFWQIRSKRVIHDELERQLYFENARLEFLGVPIFYAPLLRLPDPTVERASGFLVPTFFTSDLLNFGAKIPYFIAIDDHSDATVTAFAASAGSFVLESEYRRTTKRGSYQFNSSLLLVDDIENTPFRSLLQGTGRFALSSDYDWGFDIDVVSDKTFRAQYGYEDDDDISAQDRLLSEVFLERNRTNNIFRISSSIFQSLRTNEIDDEIPLIFPDVFFRNISDDPLLGGKLGIGFNSTTLLREAGSQYSRLGATVDWQREWHLKSGILVGAHTQLDAETYRVSDSYTGFTGSSATAFTGSSATRISPTISADIRLPLAKSVGNSTHVIEPIVQLVWNEDSLTTTPNEDSIQVEFEETNLFSINRFPGLDQKELGLRANVGVNYTIYNPKGWNFGATVGRVFRERDLGQFSAASGLSGKNSNWVSAFTLRFPNALELSNRTLLDSDFNLSKNETSLNFIYNKWQTEASYLQLDEDVIAGASDRRSEAALKLIFTPNDNWEYLAEWRHDFVTNSAIEGEFGLKYINECIEIDLSLSLQYVASGNVVPTKELGLRVSFVGIGNQARAKGRRKRCAL